MIAMFRIFYLSVFIEVRVLLYLIFYILWRSPNALTIQTRLSINLYEFQRIYTHDIFFINVNKWKIRK